MLLVLSENLCYCAWLYVTKNTHNGFMYIHATEKHGGMCMHVHDKIISRIRYVDVNRFGEKNRWITTYPHCNYFYGCMNDPRSS